MKTIDSRQSNINVRVRMAFAFALRCAFALLVVLAMSACTVERDDTQCDPRARDNQSCDAVLDEKCGCDGVTYGNACEADAHNVSVAYAGPCLDDALGASG